MEVFRISSLKYSKALSASGRSSRWNKDNEYVLYTGQSISLATLENVAHMNVLPTMAFETMVISIPDDESHYRRIYLKDLPSDWKSVALYSTMQDLGSNWYTRNESLVLQVPSAIIPQEFNYVINTRHPDFAKTTVVLVRNEEYFRDRRLFPKP